MLFIFFTRDLSLPKANSQVFGRHGLSSFHDQDTLYLSYSNLSVLLKILSALFLSESTGKSVIPIDFSLQKSSRLGFVGNDMSGISILVSFTVFVQCAILSIRPLARYGLPPPRGILQPM